jgi:hypothetical protein
MGTKAKNQEVVVEVVKSKQDLIAEAIAKLSPEELALIFPPKQMKNFVVRKSWYGRGQIITFTNNKGQTITYNHDKALEIMLPKLNILPCWIKRGYWSQSTNMPTNTRTSEVIIEIVEPITEVVE